SLQALEQHGAAAGSYLTVRRLVRCHPWCDGGHDPVPQQLPRSMRLFSRLHPSNTQPSSPKKSS
ncbi:membrane protein insertion efficiency factor YidD, partial [Klebsiella pneumoniae]